MDLDEEMPMPLPPLAPEVKINMKLDDIIKYQNMQAGVSHNMQFRRPNMHFRRPRKGRKFRPYFKRRYSSQNWRLRGNGPNTPRFRRFQFGYQHAGKIRAFLERKWRTSPMNSVFQRLGRNPLQESAKWKVWNARNYFRPQRPHFSYLKKFNQKPAYDPDRAMKLKQSSRYYNSRLGDGFGGGFDVEDQTDHNYETSQSLSRVEESLNEVIGGGEITSIKEEETEPGTLTTTIKYVSTMDNSSDHRSAMSSNGDSYGTLTARYPQGSLAMNGMGGNPAMNGMGGNPAMNGMGGNQPFIATNPLRRFGVPPMAGLNGLNSRSAMSNPPYGNMHSYMHASSMGNGSNSSFNGNNDMGYHHHMNGISATNGPSRTPSHWNELQIIRSLNEPRPSTDNNSSGQNFGIGIDQNVPIIHSTNRSITSRFGGPSTIAVMDSLKCNDM